VAWNAVTLHFAVNSASIYSQDRCGKLDVSGGMPKSRLKQQFLRLCQTDSHTDEQIFCWAARERAFATHKTPVYDYVAGSFQSRKIE